MPSAFSHIEHDAAGHFRLNFYAAIYRVVHGLHRIDSGATGLETTLRDHPFLARYLEQIVPHLPDGLAWAETLAWWQAEITRWESEHDGNLPFVALARAGYLDPTGRLAVMVAALAEEDSRFCTLFESLQQPRPSRLPSIDLIGHLLADDDAGMASDGWAVCRSAISAGLVEVVNPEAPRSEWALKVPGIVWSVLRGEADGRLLPQGRLLPPDDFPPIDALDLDPSLLAHLRLVPTLVRENRIRTLVVRGMPGGDQLRVLGSVARELGSGLAVIDGSAQKPADPANGQRPGMPLLGPLCVMCGYLPVFVYDLAPGETADIPAMPGYAGPLGIVLGSEGGLGGPAVDGAQTLTLPTLTEEQRRRCWRDALGNHAGAELEQISQRFILPAGHIRQVTALAIGHAALDQRDIVGLADIRAACRTVNRQMLEPHAALIDGGGSWSDLVVSRDAALRLRDLERRCRHRERLLQHLGSAFAGGNRGVRALLTGASGTGKTLAAKILAAELGIDLYRVDLGAVVNKYIGETEKNLHQVLSRAEALDVILLLDEGDSLLGNRTDVKSANDRYANLETNYLLQRLEGYQGIVLVTTNSAQHIDCAFQRRMDVVISFVHPQSDERRIIWQLHLPADHAVEAGFCEEVAQRCGLTGGQIRNAAMHASLLAVDEGGGKVRRWHLDAALRAEYRKAGAAYPLDTGRTTPRRDGLAAFLEAMRS